MWSHVTAAVTLLLGWLHLQAAVAEVTAILCAAAATMVDRS